MSNIPAAAISSALIPVQRATNDSLRTRKVQTDKNSHHTEDVGELDETAINSVNDQKQGQSGQQNAQDEPEERVEIESLKGAAKKPSVTGESDFSPPEIPHLDISA